MRTVLFLVALLLSIGSSVGSSVAHADRQTVTWISGTLSGNAFANTTDQEANFNAGARLSLTFEEAPLALPPPGMWDHDARLIPELFAGFYMNDVRARSQLGAGVRLEMQFTRNQAPAHPWWSMRGAIYFAPRLKISGPNGAGGAEFMIGEYMLTGGNRRIGWEGGLGIVKRPDLESVQSPELEALVNVYVGF